MGSYAKNLQKSDMIWYIGEYSAKIPSGEIKSPELNVKAWEIGNFYRFERLC